jgi:hypothetical protein
MVLTYLGIKIFNRILFNFKYDLLIPEHKAAQILSYILIYFIR